MVKCLGLIKASKWDVLILIFGTILGNVDGISFGIDVVT